MKQPPADLGERLWDVSDEYLALGQEARIDELAELSGVPRATIYYYFSGKDDVLAFLLAQKVQRAGVVVAEAAARPGAPADRLAGVLRTILHQMADHPSLCTRLQCWMSTSTSAEQLVLAAQGSLMAPVRDLIAEGQATGDFAAIDPLDATTAVVGALTMLAMHHTLRGDFDPDAVADALIPRLLGGLAPNRANRASGPTARGRRARA